MTGPVRVIRERIDPRLTGALFSNYRTPIDAALELVDNAVDSRIPGRPLDVDIAVRPGTVVLAVIGGRGMGPRELEREYLRWGGSRKLASQHIGRFGQGGKAGIGHLGNRFEITAGLPGEPVAHGFTDEAYRDRSRLRTYELVERPERASVKPTGWNVEESHPISVRAGGRLVKGWWGLLPDPTPPSAPEAAFGYITLAASAAPPEWFGHPGPAQHPAVNRLVGEVELPHVAVTLNKADVERGNPAWLEVETRLHKELAPMVRRLTRSSERA